MADKKPGYVNDCKFSGKVLRPELKSSSNGKMWVLFTLHQIRFMGKGREGKPSYHNCIMWDDVAMDFMQRVLVGDHVLITGQYWQENYTGKDGTTKSKFQFNVRSYELLKRADGSPPPPKTYDEELAPF